MNYAQRQAEQGSTGIPACDRALGYTDKNVCATLYAPLSGSPPEGSAQRTDAPKSPPHFQTEFTTHAQHPSHPPRPCPPTHALRLGTASPFKMHKARVKPAHRQYGVFCQFRHGALGAIAGIGDPRGEFRCPEPAKGFEKARQVWRGCGCAESGANLLDCAALGKPARRVRAADRRAKIADAFSNGIHHAPHPRAPTAAGMRFGTASPSRKIENHPQIQPKISP